MERRIFPVSNPAELDEVIANGKGFAIANWGGNAEDELAIKERTTATVRVLLEKVEDANMKCFWSGNPARHRAIFAASY